MSSAYTELLELVGDFEAVLRHGYRLPRALDAGESPAEPARAEAAEPAPAAPVNVVSVPAAAEPVGDASAASPAAAPLAGGVGWEALAGLPTADAMDQLGRLIRSCRACDLCRSRTKAVPGTGSLRPQVMVVGFEPSADDDRLGLPFVGSAGQFLDKWLDAIGLSRYTNAYIATLARCHAGPDRRPDAGHLNACAAYLRLQIAVLKPRALLAVGAETAAFLAGTDAGAALDGAKVFRYEGLPWMAVHHPGSVLRDPELKRPVWEALKNFKQNLLAGR